MYEEVCYKRNYLNQVVVKVDFLVPVEGLATTVPAKLANRLTQRFPIMEPGLKAFNVKVELNREGPPKSTQEDRGLLFNFFSTERNKYLSLTDSFMTIVQNKYETYEKFSEDFVEVYQAVKEFCPDVMTSRFGLRFINIFEMGEPVKPLCWEEYINPGLIATARMFNQEMYTGHVARLFHIAELKYDDIGLRFQFGEPNPDFPAIMKKAQFVLDMDAYTQGAHRPEDSFQYMEKAHTRIQGIFENSITDKLREMMDA